MFKLIFMALIAMFLIAINGAPALAGACLAKDPEFTQCTEYPPGTDEGMIKSNCKAFKQEYVEECIPPEHKYCVQGKKEEGRLFHWGTDIDPDFCAKGTWHP